MVLIFSFFQWSFLLHGVSRKKAFHCLTADTGLEGENSGCISSIEFNDQTVLILSPKNEQDKDLIYVIIISK